MVIMADTTSMCQHLLLSQGPCGKKYDPTQPKYSTNRA
jgi:hypothetical protein